MWIVRWIVSAILILLFLLFAFYNQDTLTVDFLKWTSPPLPLYIFLYIAFALGLLFWLLISALNTIKLRADIHRLQRENRKIRIELDRLRNVSIEEEVVEPPPEPKEPEPETTEEQI